jgi:hypothetical protein
MISQSVPSVLPWSLTNNPVNLCVGIVRGCIWCCVGGVNVPYSAHMNPIPRRESPAIIAMDLSYIISSLAVPFGWCCIVVSIVAPESCVP